MISQRPKLASITVPLRDSEHCRWIAVSDVRRVRTEGSWPTELPFLSDRTTVPSDTERQFLRGYPYPYCISRKVSRKSSSCWAVPHCGERGAAALSVGIGREGAGSKVWLAFQRRCRAVLRARREARLLSSPAVVVRQSGGAKKVPSKILPATEHRGTFGRAAKTSYGSEAF